MTNSILRVLGGLLLAAQLAFAAEPPAPLTAQQRAEAQAEASTAAAEAGAAPTIPSLQEGVGEKSEGQVGVAGETLDVNKLLPGADSAKRDRLMEASEDASNLNGLRQLNDEREAELQDNTQDRFLDEVMEDKAREVESHRSWVENDLGIREALVAPGQAMDGLLDGAPAGTCTTTTTRETVENSYTVWEEEVCERIVPNPNAAVCTREYDVTTTVPVIDQNERAILNVTQISNGLVCSRTVTVEENRPILSMDRVATLPISSETGGLSCERNRWAETVVEPAQRERTQSLPINQEMGGLSCSRERWAETETSSTGGSRTALLNINTETGGNSCSRTIWPTSSSGTVSQMDSATLNVDTQRNINAGVRYITATETNGSQPGAKNGTLSINGETGGLSCSRRLVPTNGTSTVPGTQTTSLNVDSQTSGELCTRYIWKTNGTGSTTGSMSASLLIDTQQSGLLCSRNRWVTSGTTNNGSISVTLGDPFGSYPLESQARWLGTEPLETYSYNFAPHIPQGTTSISGFSAVANEPFPECFGFALVSPPTLANGWVMRYQRWNNCPNNFLMQAAVSVSGTAQSSTKQWSIQESGNCAATGTTNCPATWACGTQAPTTINGISVTAAEVQALATLYSGAPGACTASTLSRTCSGTATRDTTVNISGQLPAGATAISGFTFNVSNPQSGVTVSLVQTPSQANGWNAIFRVSRTNWASGLAQPQITMNWTVGYSTVALELRESGSCAAGGTTNCPATWACTSSAPTSRSGISITAAEAGGFSPLYPGATNASCTDARKSKACSGTATQTTDVSIAGQIPAGTTSISGFTFSVQNPQAGVTVTLTQTPSAANSWVARFSVARTSWGATAPARPTITMSWNASVPTTSVTVQESGNCADPGSTFCPTAWSCAVHAPTTVGGIPLTTAMAASMAPLYPGAANTCAEGRLSRVCSGSATQGSTIGIGDVLPAGAESISNFAWTVTNPQAGVSVTLVSAPTAANGWTATFNVTRTDWNNTPASPQVSLTWDAQVPSIALGVATAGNTAASGTANCPATWSCTTQAPTTISGIAVTPEMAATQAPLYPGAPTACTRASLDLVCSGTATRDTSHSIAARLSPGTTSISNFTFTVANPQAGVAVTLIQTPSAANNWVAIFRTTRSTWDVVPQPPSVTMRWDDNITSTVTEVRDTGNCADTGTASCPVSWSCTASAPVTINGVLVTTAMANQHAPLYPGAPSTCVTGQLNRTCSGTATNDTSVSILAQLPAGTTAIENFRYSVTNPQAGVTVALIQTPSAANNWVAIFRTSRTNWASVPARPEVLLEWDVPAQNVVFSVRESGNCSDPGSTVCPTSWSCRSSAPTTINGIAVTAAMVSGETPLYPGASTACVLGELRRVCTGQATLGASIAVGDLIPAGATSIRNFAFTVNNPQPGVTVSLISAPSLANGWTATFDIVRSDFSYVPAQPNVTVNFEVDEVSIVLSVRETGNCSDPGSQACPTQWACTLSAPATVNGQSITAAMVASEPLLYPGASASCLTGQLSRVCSGTVTTTAEVAIGDLLPAGTTEIFNFAWGQENSTPGVTVALVAEPSNANGWTASFNVTRDYAQGAAVQPDVRLTWNVYGETTYEVGHEDTGDCEGGAGQGGEMCRDEWVCDEWDQDPRHRGPLEDYWRNLPPIRDIEPLDPICLRGRLVRTCEGTGSSITEVSIAEHLPEGTQAILNYRWTVDNEVVDVGVNSLQDPNLGNGWVARFETTRENWDTPPSGQPEVLLEWQIEGDPEHSVEIIEEGDCEDPGSEFCAPVWTCLEHADDVEGTVTVPKQAVRSLRAPLVPGGVVSHSVSLAEEVGAAQSITNFDANIVAGLEVAVMVTQLPTLENGWTVQLQLEKYEAAEVLYQTVNVRFTWDNIEAAPEGGETAPGMLTGAPPLYEGAPATCVRAQRTMNCDPINEGEVCHDTVEGRWCETVTPGANTCEELEQNPNCRLDRNLCSEDGMGADGHCYVQTPVYLCSREVTGEDVIVRETTTCDSAQIPICEGGICTMEEERQIEEGKVAKSMAMLAVAETMRSDWKDVPVGGGGGTTPCGGPGCEGGGDEQIEKSMPTPIAAAAASGGATIQNEDGYDPWAMPPGASNPYASNPDLAGAMMAALDPNSIRFFDGKQFNCMRALGGLLNCCTKQTPNQMNSDWWTDMMKKMRQGWTGVGACSTPGADDPQNAPGGGWEALGLNPSNESLNMGLTSLLENLNGGGDTPQCESVDNVRMENITNDWINTAKMEIMPSLAWYCDEDEFDLAAKKKLGNCHYLGTYCQSRVLGICIDRRQRYCCFNSPMSRMIRENLAEQGVATFGTAKRPTCQGITIDQFAQLNPSDLDFEDIEGRMIESGVVGDWLNMDGQDLIARLTGAMSTIGNDGRMDLDERTLARLAGIDGGSVHDGVTGEVIGSMPTEERPLTPTPGRISFMRGTAWVNRGGRVEIEVTRDGGQGAVSVRVVAVSGTAVQGSDYLLSAPVTLTWGDGDTYRRVVTVPVLKTDPRSTTEEQFELRLESPTGGASLGATTRAVILVRPEPPCDPNATGERGCG